MKVFAGASAFAAARAAADAARPPLAVAIGNFDGVHRGHQALVRAARERATQSGESCLALTFDPHPAAVLRPEQAPLSLMTVAQKAELLADLGVDVLAVLPFTLAIADDPAQPGRLRATARGRLTLKRLDFGVGQNEWAGTGQVANEVTVDLAVVAGRSR